jgi:zinc transport system substrate-binding protein
MLVFILVAAGCTPQEQGGVAIETKNGPLQVYSVNYPLAYFAERIAGDAAHVAFPAPPDIDPAGWTPTADIVAQYQSADLVLLNGAGYADWIQRVSLSQSRLVDTSAAMTEELIPVVNTATHSHGPAGDHSHQGMAFTTWLDIELAIGQAQAVSDALIRLRPEEEPGFRQRLADLELDLRNIEKRLQEVSQRIGDRPLVFSHPVYQYLIHRYGLNGHSVHWEPQEVPDEEQRRELSAVLAEHPATWMVWEGRPQAAMVGRLRGMGVESLVFRPCANRPAGGDFLSVMHDNVRALEQAFPVSEL